MGNKIIIIGAGIAGLSAGCYAQMNGYETEIFEMHNISGGLCTSWKRRDYKIDGCIHWLVGTKDKTNFNKVWNELGALEGKDIVYHDEFVRIKRNEKEFIFYSDVEKLEKHLLELAPEDESLIKDFINDIRKLSTFDPPIDTTTFLEKINMVKNLLPFMKIFQKYNITLKEFAAKFKNSFLREVLPLIFDLPDFAAFALLTTASFYNTKSGGFPIGGSIEFAQSIEKRYLSLGGRIAYKAKVSKIITKNNKAVGIRLEDGTEHYGDKIISASDGFSTIFEMLEGKYVDDKTKEYYNSYSIFQPLITVNIGVNRDLSDISHAIVVSLDNKLEIAGEKRENIGIQHYCFDKTLSPKCKSLITVHFSSNYEYWNKLYSNTEMYKKEKQTIADAVINELEKIFVGIKEQIEMVDVATPITYKRYTNNWQGSFEGWMLTPKRMKISKTLKGLSNFYMIGHWVEQGGGLPVVAVSGRNIIKEICKKDKKKFKIEYKE